MIDENNFGFAVIGKEDYARFPSGTHDYSVRGAGSESETDRNLAHFKSALKDRNIAILQWTDVADNPRVTRVAAEIAGIETVGSIIPIAILLLTSVLTGTVLWRMLQREAGMMGTLYAIGYTKSELTRHYLKYPILLSLSASVIGTLLGMAALRPMLVTMTANYNMPLDGMNYKVSILLASVMMPLILLTATGYTVVRRGLKSTPVELIRGRSGTRRIGWLERRVKLGSLGFATKFKVREQFRSIPRSLFLLLGVALATTLLLFGFTIQSSLDSWMRADSVYKYKHEYIFNSFQQGTAPGDPFSLASFKLKQGEGKSLTVFGINPDTKSIYLEDGKGHAFHYDGVIATKPLANRLRLKPGDSIELEGKTDSRTYTVTVDRIADSYNGEFIYMPLAEFNDMLHYPKDSYLGIWSKDHLDIPEEKLFSALSIEDVQKAYNSFSRRLQVVLGTTSAIAFLIGLTVIFVVTSLIMEENKGTISMMKVLGYNKKEVNRLILNSSAYLVAFGFLLGIPLLFVSLSAMFRLIAQSTDFNMQVQINFVYLLLGFVIVYVMYGSTKLLSRRKIKKIPLGEALKPGLE
ncbi:ABC transporter permease [Cohnella sp. REN36]|uniref:ABC transporter permease n=1 Tax=Cohnella sp. REN36 TaxID=2887347 RepID=UPI001D15903D|nr:ABC transporter permease [Cohnella sp. REN36]MCC3372059.1 ABC transporter permease [Cohnella sp. REN36]